MTRAWSDALPTVGLGVLTILVVIGGRQLFSPSPPTTGNPATAVTTQPRDDRTERRIERIEATLEKLQAEVDSLHRQQTAARDKVTESPEPSPAPAGSGEVRNPLNQGLDYLSSQNYDDAKHAQILSDLAATYAIPGLSPEMNNALRTTIQEVNELGTNHIISEARRLPRAKAIEQLQVFLAITPKLTPSQKARVKAVITAYRSTGNSDQ